MLSCTGGSSGPASPSSTVPGSPGTIAAAQPPPPQSTSTHSPTGSARQVMIELSIGSDHQKLECNETHLPQASIWIKEENSDWQLAGEIENNISPHPDETTHFCEKFMSSLGYFQNKANCDHSLLKFKVQFKSNGIYEGESRDITCEEREIKEGLILSIELFPAKPDVSTMKKEQEDKSQFFQKANLHSVPSKK